MDKWKCPRCGDIVKSDALKELINVFKKIDYDTVVVIVEKNDE